MKIQKIIERSTYQKVIEYEINTEKMKSLPHTFGNFPDENEFHSAFFDTNHPNHAEAYEILEHVLRPDAVYENEQETANEYWASGNDLKNIHSEQESEPVQQREVTRPSESDPSGPVRPFSGKNSHLNFLTDEEIKKYKEIPGFR